MPLIMFTDKHRRMLQSLMTQPQWEGFEIFFAHFMNREFVQSSAKRDTEFETIWQCAAQEGARAKLNEFKILLEEEAKLVITK